MITARLSGYQYKPRIAQTYNSKLLLKLARFTKKLAGARVWWEDKKMAPGVQSSPGPGSGDVVEQESPSLIREGYHLSVLVVTSGEWARKVNRGLGLSIYGRLVGVLN